MNDRFRADLHVHTLLSPCGSEEMTPLNIVRYAQLCGLEILAITDHNTMGNAGAVIEAAERWGLTVFPGIEVQTREEVHILGIFPDLEAGSIFAGRVYESLPEVSSSPREFFGEQVLVDAHDRRLGEEQKALFFSSDLNLEEAVGGIREHGGLAVASHVERRSYGLIGQLGFIPPDLELDALEVSRNPADAKKAADLDGIAGEWRLVASSDAHQLKEIGMIYTEFGMERPTFSELKKSIRGCGRRDVRIVTTG